MKKVISLVWLLALVVLGGCSVKESTGSFIGVSEDPGYIAKLSDIPPHSMKEFTYKGSSAIIVNFDGELKAYVNECTHAGAKFDESSLKSDRIECPLHGATFKPTTGEYLGHSNGNNFGLAGLTMIDIKVENGKIYAQ